MKRTMRVLLPLVLALAVLGSAAWYLFVYDRDFTRDVLLQQARYWEGNNQPLAAWFYNQAYSQANQDEDVAIELAMQYRAAGNYTKAEYTLSNAIADGGTAKLYQTLCQIYVEQDKLLDAVNMLDTVSDPAVKAELDAMRPAAPVCTPEPGFYTQYISVTLEAQGTLYYSDQGEYPSISSEPYSAPLDLGQGETTIYALAVADNGLVSPLVISGYTVGGVIEPVDFADPAMEAAMRQALGVDENKTVYTNDLWTISSFTVPSDARSYGDLALLTYLQSLQVENGIASELHYIASLSRLEELAVTGCNVSDEDLASIAALPELKRLTLEDCGLVSINALSTAQDLVYLNLNDNTIGNLTSLGGMAELQELHLSRNAVTDLGALTGLNDLTILDVSYNSLTSIAPVCGIRPLARLDVSHNNLATLGAVDNLPALTFLAAAYNHLTEAEQLGRCTNLEELDISNNDLTEIGYLSALNKLVKLNFSYNQVVDLPQWSTDCALVTIDGSYNQIETLAPLAGLGSLNNVLMDYNTAIASVEELADCPNLIQVNVFGTAVTDASALTDQSIIVNFDPTAGVETGGEDDEED